MLGTATVANCLRNTDGGPIKMRVRSTHKRVLRPVAIVAGWWDEGVFFSQTHNVGGCTTRVFVLRCGTTIKRVDSLCTDAHGNPRPACFVRVWALLLQEHACPFEQHGSSKRVAVCKV